MNKFRIDSNKGLWRTPEGDVFPLKGIVCIDEIEDNFSCSFYVKHRTGSECVSATSFSDVHGMRAALVHAWENMQNAKWEGPLEETPK